ncbi:Uncharacterized protein PBTT_02779 [Plasmodiophora brassicae]
MLAAVANVALLVTAIGHQATVLLLIGIHVLLSPAVVRLLVEFGPAWIIGKIVGGMLAVAFGVVRCLFNVNSLRPPAHSQYLLPMALIIAAPGLLKFDIVASLLGKRTAMAPGLPPPAAPPPQQKPATKPVPASSSPITPGIGSWLGSLALALAALTGFA